VSRLEARGVRSIHVGHVGPLDCRIDAGSCLALWGPSGSGKSLLLRALADLDPHTGEVLLDGAPQASMDGPAWRRRVGYLPAESGWWRPTVGEHFAGGAVPAQLGFPADVASWPVARLSSGERQRLALLRLLEREPDVLLLDEPTANLDQDAARAVEELVASYRTEHGAAVLWVGHDPAQRRRVADAEIAL
jgi:ABC-type iron transport system FetAB ATPase subunit